MHSYIDAIRSFEGFAAEAKWDYAQLSNGYGTRARYAGEVIDNTEAERRFQAAVADARIVVERHAPRLDEGTKAALTSLTYNTGQSWLTDGLGKAAEAGDIDAVRAIFVEYNKAGGEVLPGLVSRRAAEALWIGNPELIGSGSAGTAGNPAAAQAAAASNPGASNLVQSYAPAWLGGPQRVLSDHAYAAGAVAGEPVTLASAEAGPGLAMPLPDGSLTDIVRLMKLEGGHELLAGEARQDDRGRERSRDA